MKGKMFLLGLLAVVAGGCVPVSQNSAGQSLEWRVRSLEESFLNIKEKQREQSERQIAFEQFVTSRLAEVEDRLGIQPAAASPQLGMGEMAIPFAEAPASVENVNDLEQQIVQSSPADGGLTSTPLMQHASATEYKEGHGNQRGGIQPWALLPQGAVNKQYPVEPKTVGSTFPPASIVPAPGQQAVVTESPSVSQPKAPAKSVKKSNTAKKKKSTKPVAPSGSAKRLYEHALSQILTGKNYEGRTALKKFLRENPSSTLAPNALYWLGESYYSEKNFGKAILTFKEVSSKYPEHAKAADALLKIGMSYQKMGDADNAGFYLRVLADDYPKTKAAKQASSLLRTLSS